MHVQNSHFPNSTHSIHDNQGSPSDRRMHAPTARHWLYSKTYASSLQERAPRQKAHAVNSLASDLEAACARIHLQDATFVDVGTLVQKLISLSEFPTIQSSLINTKWCKCTYACVTLYPSLPSSSLYLPFTMPLSSLPCNINAMYATYALFAVNACMDTPVTCISLYNYDLFFLLWYALALWIYEDNIT